MKKGIAMDEQIIKKVVLQLGKKEVELTVDEAKKLHAALNEMFEQKVVTVERYVHHEYPQPWRWTWPYTYTTGVTISPTYPTTTTPIWYSSSGGSVSYDSNSSGLMLSIQ